MANLLQTLGISANQYHAEHVEPSNKITQSTAWEFGTPQTTVSTMLGSGKKAARNRLQIYEKLSYMESDPLCSTALSLLVTAALGGHENSGQMVFIEQNPKIKSDKRLEKIVAEISEDLTDLVNRHIYSACYTACAFGDAYGRVYSEKKTGITDFYGDELVRPPLVQAYEQGSRLVGFSVSAGKNAFTRLNPLQMVRFKMPRVQYIPQPDVIQKAAKMTLDTDDITLLPVIPSSVGGSLLYAAEEAYDDLYSALVGLVGMRWMDSIDEEMVGVNMDSMTKEQQEKFLESIINVLKRSKELAESAASGGKPVLERVRHIIPVFGEKQVTSLTPAKSGPRGVTVSIEDVLFHAKRLASAIGPDLSMLGFSDILGGGLGEGGFFRMSAQVAERSRIIRAGARDFVNDLINVHCYHKYGVVFENKQRPWLVNFYGSISALEEERTRTRNDAMNSALIFVQALQQFKEAGATKEMMETFLSTELMVDEEHAKLYADIVNQQSQAEQGAEAGFDQNGQQDMPKLPGVEGEDDQDQ